MSDAFTDIARDERRAQNYTEYLETLFKYLTGTETEEGLIESSKQVDDVPRGFWNGRTELASEENLNQSKKLKAGDDEAWLKFLTTLQGETQKKFQKISPFANKHILSIRQDWKSIFKVNSQSLREFLNSKTPEKKHPSSSFHYVVVLDTQVLDDAQVQVIEEP